MISFKHGEVREGGGVCRGGGDWVLGVGSIENDIL